MLSYVVLTKIKDASVVPFLPYAVTVWLSGWVSRPFMIMAPYTSYEEGEYSVRMSERIKPYSTLVSGDVPCPTHG